ncbi:PKD domain-containing protein [Microscilla marina]|uniref:PKD domain-containing protein n=1 Tax=Microscilla marina TaxID=1027 RepID=UPI0009E21148|nr:PKD domain-containing protein [Microscilla marina]
MIHSQKLYSLFICLTLLIHSQLTLAQGFNIPDNSCPNTDITFTSPNPGANRHFWDFCPGDLVEASGSGNIIATGLNGVTRPLDIATVFDGTNWYSFMPDFRNAGVARAFYGNSLDNTPVITNLAGFTGSLNQSCGIDIINDNGTWYGLIVNFGNNTLTKLNFGSDLGNNTPVATVINSADLDFPTHLSLVKDGSKFVAVAANWKKNLVIFDFGNSMANAPTTSATANLLKTGAGDHGVWGFDLIKGDDNQWYGIGATTGPTFVGPININYISFGATINNTPTIKLLDSEIEGWSDVAAANEVGAGFDVEIVREGNRYYALILTNKYVVLKLDLGEKISDPKASITNLGGFNVLARTNTRETFGFSVNKDKSDWFLYVANQSSNLGIEPFFIKIKLDNPTNCNNSVEQSVTSINPSNRYILSSKYYTELEVFDANMQSLGYYIDSTNIDASVIPQFTPTNLCISETTVFQNQSIGSDSDVNSWDWDFGDGTVSTLKNPSHTYTIPGTYQVKLTPKTVSGTCDNALVKTIKIRPMPKAEFQVGNHPAASQAISFTNNSIVQNESSKTSYLWLFDDGTFSINKNPSHTYTKAGVYNVSLTVTDTTGGCSSFFSKSVTVGAVPEVNFDLSQKACTKTPLTFVNTSKVEDNVGSEIVSYQWNFGGAGTSTEKTPIVTFDFVATYEVSLTVTTNLGVSNTFKKSISFQEGLQSSMQMSTTTGDAPLSVSFTNQTSGALSYLWDFGDGKTSTDANAAHVYDTPGIYTVTFSAYGANGCSIPVTKQVIVSASNTVTEIALTNVRIQDDNIFIELTNNGNTPIISSNLRVVLNNTDTLTGQWSGVLNSLQSTEYLFTLQTGQGSMVSQVCAYIIDVNARQDAKTLDNSFCKNTLDAQVTNALVQGGSCIMFLKNNAQVPVTKLKIVLDFGNTTQETVWTGLLNTNEQTNYIVPLPVSADELASSPFFCASISQINDTTDAVATNNVACQEYDSQFKILGINPNPAVDYINIDYFLPSEQNNDVVKLQIISSQGVLMGEVQLLNLIAGRNNYRYATNQLGTGLYTLVFIRGNAKIVKKVLIK